MENQVNFLDIVKQEALANKQKELLDKAARDAEVKQQAINCILDKSKWSYDVNTKCYTLMYEYALYGMKMNEIEALLKEQLNKDVAWSRKEAIGLACDCDIVCHCRKKLVVCFKE